MKRLLFYTCVYPPEPVGLVEELALFLSHAHWEVTVVTGFPSYPAWKKYKDYSQGLWAREKREGIDVLRTWNLDLASQSIFARSAQSVRQAVAMGIGGALSRRADVVLVYGPPLVGPALGWAVARRHRARLVNLIHDIYPDIALKTGHIKNPLVIATARAAERFQYWGADKTVVLSEGFRNILISKGVPDEKIAVVPVWIDQDKIAPSQTGNTWRQDHGVPTDKSVVMFSGTVGLVSGAPVIAEAANLLCNRADIVFVVVGDGGLKPELLRRAKRLRVENLIFLPPQPKERLGYQLDAADICLVTFGKDLGHTSFPSKMLAYMAAGKPVLASVDLDCDTAREVREHGFGLVVPPGNPQALADGVAELVDDPQSREIYGKAARSRVEEHFTKDKVLEQFERVLRSVVEKT